MVTGQVFFCVTVSVVELPESFQEQWSGMASAKREPMTGAWDWSHQRGPETEPLVKGRS